MCTVTWTRERGALHVFFNRDESARRAIGLPPTIRKAGDITFVSPQDPDGRGTWFAVNDHGIAACVLNAPGGGGRRETIARRDSAGGGGSQFRSRCGGASGGDAVG